MHEVGTKYRLGALSVGYKGYRMGVNSEKRRHAIQNHAIHNSSFNPFGVKIFNKAQRGFKNQSWDYKDYFQCKTLKFIHVMVKNIIVFLIFITLTSCFHHVNAYGKRRYDTITFSAYPNTCRLMDSVNIFRQYYKLEPPPDFKYGKLRTNYLVFYEGGKVGNFLDFDEKQFDFDPAKAEMGYYGVKDGKCLLKFKTEYPDRYKILEEEIVFIDKETIKIHTKKSGSTDGFTSTYLKVTIQKIKNKKSPDW